MHILTSLTDYFALLHQGRFVFVSKNIFLVFKCFYLCSGLKLNFDKTVAVWIGQMVNSDIVLCPEIKMTWSNSFTLLGIEFNTDLKQMIKNNYESKVQIIKNTLNSYKKRNMSILGKVTVLKTIIIPKLVYLMKSSHHLILIFLRKWRDALIMENK